MDKIRFIDSQTVTETVRDLFAKAVRELPDCVASDIRRAADSETNQTARDVMATVLDNLDAARRLGVPICQDTGMAVVFADVGRLVHVTGASLEEAVNEGVRLAYVDGALRLSVVDDPLFRRKNTNDNTPAVLHIRTVSGAGADDKLVLTAAPKGFGSENMSALKMMTPSATEDDVADFVVDTVLRAGANPCPPVYVGVGIGSDFEGAALLSKRAILRSSPSSDPDYRRLEEKIKERINALGVGPQGFGGDVTCLAVYAEHAPTHIAGLPVAVNINCHVSRHVSAVI